MKKIYLITLFFLTTTLANAQQEKWNRKNVIKGTVANDVLEISPDNLIVLTTSGVYASTDQALTWTKRSADMDADLSTFMSDFDPETLHTTGTDIYAYFRENLYRSGDEGVTWVKISPSINLDYNTNFAVKGSKIYLTYSSFMTNLSTVYVSSDKGITWNEADTVSGQIFLYTYNNELYVYGGKGSSWNNRTPLLNKMDANDKFVNIPVTSAGAGNRTIQSMSNAGGNLVIMLPRYAQGSGNLEATELHSYNFTNWTKGSEFTANYVKLYEANGVCYHPFFNKNYFLKSNDGITWTEESTTQRTYFSSITGISGGKIIITSRGGVHEADVNLNLTERNEGFYSPYLAGIEKFGSKIFVHSTEQGLYSSEDNTQTFTKVNGLLKSGFSQLKSSKNRLYFYNPYINMDDVVLTSTDGQTWDTLAMPAIAYKNRELLSVGENGAFFKITDATFTAFYYFYNDNTNTWANVSAGIPQGVSGFNIHYAPEGKFVLVSNMWGPNGKKTELYMSNTDVNAWSKIKHSMGNVWYENLTVANNKLYYLKNQYERPDTLFRISNDSLVFDRKLSYGNFNFYTNTMNGSFMMNGDDIYCMGFDTTHFDIKIIRSKDAGLTWSEMTEGLPTATAIEELYLDQAIYAITAKGMFEFSDKPVGMQNNRSKHTHILTYPNPSNEQLNIRFDEAGEYAISIYSIEGRLMNSTELQGKELAIKTNMLKDGLYILKVKGVNWEQTERIIVQH